MRQKSRVSWVFFVIAVSVYIINILGILFTVIVDSFGRNWFKGMLPNEFSLKWYEYTAADHNIPRLLFVTFLVVVLVVVVSIVVALPASYVMARHDFKFKSIIMTLFLLPMLIPPMTYGVPLAIILLSTRMPNLLAVILGNLVPIIPFMILILTPFIEQVGVNMESAARMLGANKLTIFRKILIPLIMPGILTAGIMSIVKAIAAFELTYLIAANRYNTLVVALYADATAAGSRPTQAIDAMAVIYFVTAFISLVIALFFVNPTQMVFKIK